MIGQDNGYLKILSFVGMSEKKKDGKRDRLWNCQCGCGNIIVLPTKKFVQKIPRSCGCYKPQGVGNRTNHSYLIKHGLSVKGKRHPLIRLWYNIKTRCYNAKSDADKRNYQNKGITILEEWKHDSVKFVNWAKNNGWKLGLQIDRIDPNKGYHPDNIQFITASENSKKVFTDNPGFKRGSNSHSAKINEEDVRDIKKMLLLGMSNCTIAKIKHIKKNVVYQIKYKKTWKHVE